MMELTSFYNLTPGKYYTSGQGGCIWKAIEHVKAHADKGTRAYEHNHVTAIVVRDGRHVRAREYDAPFYEASPSAVKRDLLRSIK